jgi:hypothetical protein
MGKDHVTALLDALLVLDADGVGARAAADASAALPDVPGEFKIALVVADDLMGGWTNRYDYEFTFRFGSAHRPLERGPDSPSGFHLSRWLKHFWLTGVLWSSEPPRSGPRGRRSSCPPIGSRTFIDKGQPARSGLY